MIDTRQQYETYTRLLARPAIRHPARHGEGSNPSVAINRGSPENFFLTHETKNQSSKKYP